MNKEFKVFVYGTLKQGHGNYMRLLKGRAAFMGTDSIKGKLFDLGSFPCITEGGEDVHGEVFMVGPNTLQDLDWLEGHPNFYCRKQTTTRQGHEVWVYYIQQLPSGAKHLPAGVWK